MVSVVLQVILGFVAYLKPSCLEFEIICVEHQNSNNLFQLSKQVRSENKSFNFSWSGDTLENKR